MLITFKSDAYADITMFGHVARAIEDEVHCGALPGLSG